MAVAAHFTVGGSLCVAAGVSSGVAGLKHETVQVKIVKKAFTLNVQAVAANSKFFKATKNRHGI